MTDGTSQGLFVVVAIVIFGIFVALSYTVFGSDGLSGGMQGLFSDSIEQTENRAINQYNVSEFKTSDLVGWGNSTDVIEHSENRIEFSSHPTLYRAGVYVPAEYFKVGRTYTVSFYIQKTEGTVAGLGGHLFFTDNTDIRINGESVGDWDGGTISPLNTNSWSRTVIYPDDNDRNFVELTFRRDRYRNPDMNDLNFYIQPNRTASSNYIDNGYSYTVVIEDFNVVEH